MSAPSVISCAPLLAAVEHRHAGGGIEIGLGCLRQTRHHHVAADGENGLDDLLVAEMLSHAGEHGIVYADVLRDFAAEGKQCPLGLVEGWTSVVTARQRIDLRL